MGVYQEMHPVVTNNMYDSMEKWSWTALLFVERYSIMICMIPYK